jgi:hypothetical protein
MTTDLPWNGIIKNSAEELADAAIELYTNNKLWQTSVKIGFRILEQEFSSEVHQERFRKELTRLKDNLEEHRLQNFTGQMLQHHSLQSTKFLAKYIEAKNRNRP